MSTDTRDPNRVLIFDTTLRDGEQSPGATMSHAEKLEIAQMLDEMGVDIIEAGFPIASEGDFAAVSEIARQAKNAVICGLARAQFPDIDRCWEAVRHARRPRIHTFIGTSPLHRAIPNLTMDEMADRIHQTVTHARNLCEDVQWSPMDATRTEHDYLCRVVEIAIRAGATTINIPDTVGYTAPRESAALIRMLLERVPGAGGIIATNHVAKSSPDGYTLFLSWDTHSINPVVVKDLPYDTFKDFTGVSLALLNAIADRIFETHLGIPRWVAARLWQQAASSWMLVDGELQLHDVAAEHRPGRPGSGDARSVGHRTDRPDPGHHPPRAAGRRHGGAGAPAEHGDGAPRSLDARPHPVGGEPVTARARWTPAVPDPSPRSARTARRPRRPPRAASPHTCRAS